MSGRYAGELFVRVEGDRDAAPAYLPAARLLMGEVLEQASFNELGTHLLRRQLRDGAVLIAEKIGDLNRVTIAPPPPSGRKRPIRVFDDILVFAGEGEYDATGSRVRPPTILSHDADMRWRAYFASTKAPGYYSAAGTYSDVFPDVMKDYKRLYGGNCFHRNNEGIVTSWASASICIGPQARNPAKAYSVSVFCLGMLLFTLLDDDGQTGAYNRVLAAAIHEGSLLVLVASLSALDYPLRPAVPTQDADAWASKLYSDDANPTALLRYKLKTKVDPLSYHYYYETDYASEETLWVGELVRGYNRWTFDNEAAQFVSVQLPRQPVLLYRGAVLVEPLSSDEQIFRVGEAGLSMEPAGDVVFEDGGLQVRLEVVDSTTLDFVTPTRRIPAVRLTETEVTYCALLYASPVDDRYVLSSIREATRTSGGGPFTGAHRAWLTAVEGDTEVEFSTSPAGDTAACSSFQLLSKYFGDLTSGGSGISKACHATCGWLFYKTPGTLTEGVAKLGWLNALQLRAGVAGHIAGGLSSGNLETIPERRNWSSTLYFGRQLGAGGQPTVDPVYDPSGNVVLLYANVIGSKHALAVHREDPSYSDNTYLTGGDVDALTGGVFDTPFFSPLGKPHPQQPMERPA